MPEPSTSPASPPAPTAASTGGSPAQSPEHGFRKCLGASTQSSDLVIILKVMQELPEVVTLRLAPAPLTLALMVQGVQPHVLQGKAGKKADIII